MKQPGFIGPSYTSVSVNVDAQRTLNMYPESDERGTGKNQEVMALIGRPGLKWQATVAPTSGTGTRGAHYTTTGKAYMVIGSDLFDVTDPTAPVNKGTLDTSSGPVGMADNRLQLAMVDGTNKVYLLNLSTFVFSSAALPDPSDRADVLSFQDGYFIVNRHGTLQYYISALYNGASWDALDVGSKEGQPDNIISLISDHRQVVLFGERSAELHQNTGDANFPFQRINGPGGFLEEGIAGPQLRCKIDNTIFWVKKDRNGAGSVMRMADAFGQRVSTHPIENALKSYGDQTNGTCWTMLWRGHPFVYWNFAGADRTWGFDVSTQLWHECDYTPNDGSAHSRWRAEGHIVLTDGRHITGDYANGNVYLLDESYIYDDVDHANPSVITAQRDTPAVSDEGKWVNFPFVFLDMETGVGPAVPLQDGNGNPRDPVALLSWSDDGGHTFGNEHEASIGAAGKYRTRARWNKCGRSKDRIFRVKITDPVKRVLISGIGDTYSGAH